MENKEGGRATSEGETRIKVGEKVEIKEESRKNGAEMRSERSGDANDSETIDRNDASFQRNAWPRGDCATRRKFAAHFPRLRAQLSCPLHAIARVVRAKVGILYWESGRFSA